MQKTIWEPARELPVLAEADVVVCGGGPAGIMAAVAAARNGADTVLIERYGFLGGMATAGLVGPICKYRCRGEQIVGGIPYEFILELARQQGAIASLPSGAVPFDAETYKLLAARMVRQAGVRLMLHSLVTGCVPAAGEPLQPEYVIIENKSGRQAVRTSYLVDCTGTADVVVQAGLPWHLRRKTSGELQPLTLVFRLGGVDTDHLENILMAEENTKYFNRRLRAVLEEQAAGGVALFGGPWLIHGSTLRKGEVTVNVTRYPGSAVDAKDLTEAECRLREDVAAIVGIFRAALPELRQCYLLDTATQVGIRETRAIESLYNMTVEDILNPRPFADTVAKGAHPVDIHRPADTGQDVQFISEAYNIPYRSLIPRGAKNVLVAGGSIGATAEAFASIRVQAQCMALGQAAGTAAALCKEMKECPVAELPYERLRTRLRQQGAII